MGGFCGSIINSLWLVNRHLVQAKHTWKSPIELCTVVDHVLCMLFTAFGFVSDTIEFLSRFKVYRSCVFKKLTYVLIFRVHIPSTHT